MTNDDETMRRSAGIAGEPPATSSWLTTPYGAPYVLPPAGVVLEIYRRPLSGGWWIRVVDRGGLPLRVAADCARGGFAAAVGQFPGEYHLLPVDVATGQPAAARGPGWVRVDTTLAAARSAAVMPAMREDA